MAPLLDEPARIEHQHQVGGLGGREAVGHADRGAAPRRAQQRARQRPLGLRVDGAGRLVEHEQPGLAELRACERDQLALADRQALAPLADLGVETVGHAREPPVETERHERGLDVGVGRALAAEAHVLANRRVEQEAVLRHEADASTAFRRRDRTQVDAAELDATDGGVGQAAQQLGERRLARAGLADDGDVGARRAARRRCRAARGRLRGRRTRRRVARTASGPGGSGTGAGRLHDVDGHVEHVDHLAPAGDRGLRLVEDLAQLRDRAEDQVREEQERDDLADVEPEAAGPRRRRRR